MTKISMSPSLECRELGDGRERGSGGNQLLVQSSIYKYRTRFAPLESVEKKPTGEKQAETTLCTFGIRRENI